MKPDQLKKIIVGQLAFAAGLVVVLTLLWEFGLRDILTGSMGKTASHVLAVFVVGGIAILAVILPGSLMIRKVCENVQEWENKSGQVERRYRSIVESTTDLIFEIDPDEKIVFANPAVKLIGYERQELLGEPIIKLIPKGLRKEIHPRITTRRIGFRATLNCPVSFLTNEDSVLSEEIPQMEFLVDANGLWREPDDVVSTKGTEKTYLGTLVIARIRVHDP